NEPAARNFRQVGAEQRRKGAGHRDLHEFGCAWDALGAAAQHQAQQGAARAGGGADGADCRSAVCRSGKADRDPRDRRRVLPPGAALWLHGRDRRSCGAEGRSRLRRAVRDDADQLLPFAPDAAFGRNAWHGAVAREAVCLDDAQLGDADGVLPPADKPGGRAGEPGGALRPRPEQLASWLPTSAITRWRVRAYRREVEARTGEAGAGDLGITGLPCTSIACERRRGLWLKLAARPCGARRLAVRARSLPPYRFRQRR